MGIASVFVSKGVLVLSPLDQDLLIIGLPMTIFTALFFLLDRIFWNTALGKSVLGICDLSGEWEGKIQNDQPDKLDVRVSIKQTWTVIRITFTTSVDVSHCISSTLDTDKNELVWIYEFEPASTDSSAQPFGEGYAKARFIEEDGVKTLRGRYQSSRGKFGTFELQGVSK